MYSEQTAEAMLKVVGLGGSLWSPVYRRTRCPGAGVGGIQQRHFQHTVSTQIYAIAPTEVWTVGNSLYCLRKLTTHK